MSNQLQTAPDLCAKAPQYREQMRRYDHLETPDKVEDREPVEVIEFDRDTDRWGDVWSAFVPGIGPGQLYHFQ